jgi:putative effector of murein hydrolase LrgA (UPF0299 family)
VACILALLLLLLLLHAQAWRVGSPWDPADHLIEHMLP